MWVVKMKAIVRSYIWRSGMEKETELTAKSCSGCQLTQREPSTVLVHPWEWPSWPWQLIHIDFSGPFLNSMFLVVMDAHSRWLEVERMNEFYHFREDHCNLSDVICQVWSARPVSKRPQLKSKEFEHLLKRNGIKNITSALSSCHQRQNRTLCGELR